MLLQEVVPDAGLGQDGDVGELGCRVLEARDDGVALFGGGKESVSALVFFCEALARPFE